MTRKCFHLLDTEREYLTTGTPPGTYRDHVMDDRLLEKVTLLPTRFQCLWEDIALLAQGPDHETNLLATEAGRSAWATAMGIDTDAPESELERTMLFHRGDPGSGPASFGAELGKALNRFMHWPASDDVHQAELVADLVWGVLRGLTFDLRRAGDVTGDVIREDTADLLAAVEDRADAHANTLDPHAADVGGGLEQRAMMMRAIADRVEEILGDDMPTAQLELPWGFGEFLADEQSDRNQFGTMVAGYIVDDAVGGGSRLYSVGQVAAFWEAYGPVDEFDVDTFVSESRVRSVVNDHQLYAQFNLLRQLEHDATALDSKGCMGASADEILPRIVEDGPVSSAELAKAEYESDNYQASVTRLGKDLAGVECDNRADEIDVWIDRPLVDGDRDGWEATRYGIAAAHALRLYQATQATQFPAVLTEPVPTTILDDALAEIQESSLDA